MTKKKRVLSLVLSLCLAATMMFGLTIQAGAMTHDEYYEHLEVAFPAGFAYMKTDTGSYFVECGKDGSALNLWTSGDEITSAVLTDANGSVVKMTFSKIQKVDGMRYARVAAFSKAGGYNFSTLSATDAQKLKDAGLYGIVTDKAVINW